MKRFFVPNERNGARVRLVCLPYAGASAAVFRALASALPPEIEVWAPQLPGKGWRMREEPVSDLSALADEVAEAVWQEVPRPLAVFGHSMGSWLGLEVVRRLEARGVRPVVLFTSGRHAPALGHIQPPIGHLEDDEFIAAVDRRYGGIPSEVLADRDLLSLLLPALRADFLALETFQPLAEPVQTPIIAMRGETDPLVSREQILPWAEATDGPFEVSAFPGGHFFFDDDPDPLQKALAGRLLDRGGERQADGGSQPVPPGSIHG